MAVKATDQITLAVGVDVSSVDNYYKLQASSANPPTKPTTANPTGWSTTEPTYDGTTTNTLYICTKTTLTDNTFYWSAVSVSSSYEAAKQAANLANAANTLATAINNYFWHDSAGAHVGTVEGEAHTSTAGYNMTLGATNSNVGIVLEHNADILASFTAQALQFYANGLLSASYSSNGALLYAAINALAAVVAAFTASGVSFYDGNGTTADNIIAAFGSTGAQIGKNSETHIKIDNDSFDIVDNLNRLLTHIDRQGWWRYMPVDEYPDGDTTKPANPDYDPDNPSTLESFIGHDSDGLAYVFDKVIFGDWRSRNVYDYEHDLWWPTPGREVTIDVRSPEDSVLRLTATEYREGQMPAPSGATIEIGSSGGIGFMGNCRHHSLVSFVDELALPNAGTSTDFFVTGINAFANGGRLAYKGLGHVKTWLGHEDTAWAYLVGNSSSNRVRYRKKAGIVFVEVWYESSAGLSTTAKTLATLPAAFRPDVQVETAAFGNVNHLVMLRVNPGGSIVAKVMSGTTNYIKGCISFPAV